MNDLVVTDCLDLIESWISPHIDAKLEIVESKHLISGKLARCFRDSETAGAVIQLPRFITALEMENSLLALAMRGQMNGKPELVRHADEIQSSLDYLKHLVLHEVAHMKNNWGQDRETDCDIWVYEQMHFGT